jgi:hypothetical protein
MRKPSKTKIIILCLILLLLGGAIVWVFWWKPPDASPKPLNKEVVKAWSDAGATAGWIFVGYKDYKFVQGVDFQGEAGSSYRAWLPGFQIRSWDPELLKKVPVPQLPFGLDLSRVSVPDDGLKELARFKSLRSLLVYRQHLRDTSLSALRAAGLLHALSEAGGEDSLRPADADDVRHLNLDQSQVTDAGLKELVVLKSLRSLSLTETQVTDAGLKELAFLKNLQTLDLSRTKVTAEGLKELANVKSLRDLKIPRGIANDMDVAALRETLRGCTISTE